MSQNKLYHFLFDSNYRLWRHLIFILTLAIITFNQTFIVYQDNMSALGNTVFLICFLSFVTYLLTTYLNYFYLIPKFLLKENYTLYIVLLICIVVALMGFTLVLEYAIRTILSLPHRITSYSNPIILIDSLSSSAMTIICLWSMSVIKLFRKWNKKNEDVMMLEQNFLEIEVNKLKGQVSPIFMSRALRKAALITASHPQKASQILMLLGHLLRYQLYDCDRNKVFLNSEIIFLKNLLQLKKFVEDSHFEYVLEVKGKTNNLLISPLLLIVLIQSLLIANEIKSLNIDLIISEKKIRFIVNYENTYLLPPEYKMEITEKLNMLYPDLYIFTIQSGIISLQVDLNEWK